MTDIPHFSLPFRFITTPSGVKAAETEQDTNEEITDCVEAIIRYERGQRPDAPDFGIDHQVFSLDVDSARIHDQIIANEPRADVLVEDQVDAIDDLIRRVTVGVVGIIEHKDDNVQ